MKKIKFAVLALLLFPLHLAAQFTVKGNIIDNETEQTLPNAYLSLSNAMTTISDENGNFQFNEVKKGFYTLTVSFLGFEPYEKKVEVKNNVQLYIRLRPATLIQETVVVKASRIDSKTPITHTNVDALEITKTNKGADLPYMLQNVPSLIVSSDAGAGVGYTAMRIRGADLTRINVTLNGVPVNGAEDYQVYFVDLPDLASSVDNIQVQRGVGTSVNGPASFGASLNIKTIETPSEPYAIINSAAGSYNTFKNTFMFSSGRNEKGFSINGRLSNIVSDGYIDRAWSKLNSYYLSGSWTGKNTIVKAIMMHGSEQTYQAWNGCPKDSINSNPTYNPSGIINDSDGNFEGYYNNETDNYTQNYYQLHVVHNFNAETNIAATLFTTTGLGYYNNYKNNKSFSNYGLNDFVCGNDTIGKTNLIQQKWLDNIFYGFNLALNQNIGRFSSSYGGGWSRFNGDHYGIVDWAEYGFPLNYEWYRNKGVKTDYNVYAKTNFKVSESFNLFADLQYRHVDYNIEGIHDDLRDITQHHIFNFWNPKAGVFYSINDKQNAYFSIGYSNREPLRDIYTDSDPNQIDRVKAEKLLDYELGYSYKNTNFNLNTNLFYMDYTDQLVLTGEINNVGESVMTNADNSYRLGIELSSQYKISRQFFASANLSLSRNKIQNFVTYVEEYDADWNYIGQKETIIKNTDISFSPSVIGGINLSFRPLKDLEISFHEKYISRQYLDNTSNSSRSLDPYFLSNLHFNYQWQQNWFKDLSLSLSINNLFNNRYCTNAWVYRALVGDGEYIEDGYFPQAGINFMMGVNIKL